METVKQLLALQQLKVSHEKMLPLIRSAENSDRSNPTIYGKLYRYVYEMGNALFDYGETIPANGDIFGQYIAIRAIEDMVVARFPLPERNVHIARGAYIHRAALREVLSETLKDSNFVSFRLDGEHALTFVFAPNTCPIDHDNYVVKPIIDTICTAFGIDDNGKSLSTCYYTESESETLSPWLYAILSPGPDCLSKSAAVALAMLVAPDKLQPMVDGY